MYDCSGGYLLTDSPKFISFILNDPGSSISTLSKILLTSIAVIVLSLNPRVSVKSIAVPEIDSSFVSANLITVSLTLIIKYSELSINFFPPPWILQL